MATLTDYAGHHRNGLDFDLSRFDNLRGCDSPLATVNDQVDNRLDVSARSGTRWTEQICQHRVVDRLRGAEVYDRGLENETFYSDSL